MATATRTTTADAKTRSLELATARGETHCSHAAKMLDWTLDERGQLVSLALSVASATSKRGYVLTYSRAADDAPCSCEAAQHARGCWHRGLALLCGRYVARRAAHGWQED